MATVMQDTASSSTKKPSVAERSFREVISHKFDRDDTSMEVYARVWHDEVVEEKCGSRHPKTESYFSVSGRWATERLLEVPVEYYSQTSRYLFVCVADAWLCSTNVEDTKLFGKVLRDLPLAAGKLASSAIRSVLESRYPDRAVPVLVPRLAEFFLEAEVPSEENEVFRTVSKALGKYAKMEDLVVLGQVLYALNSGNRTLVAEKIAIHIGPQK